MKNVYEAGHEIAGLLQESFIDSRSERLGTYK
jgi:hypothetical protein